MTDDDPLLGYRELAEELGVTVQTLRNYRTRQVLPPPDDTGISGDRPAWRRSTIEVWKGTRPGQGAGGGRRPKLDGEP